METKSEYYMRLKEGEEFEKYWCELIKRKLCMTLTRVRSKNHQLRTLCDTQEGFEFKYDRKKALTKNFWIEVGQRPPNTEEEYRPSSLLRKDNSWMYCIGNLDVLYLIPKKTLLNEYRNGRREVRENKRKTSKGFLISEKEARLLSALYLTPDLDHKTPLILEEIKERSAV